MERATTIGIVLFVAVVLLGATSASAQIVYGDTTVRELGNFDRFLDSHPWVNRDLRANPGLINDPNYVRQHPELRDYLRSHPGVRQEIRENPRAFMRGERWYNRNENRIRDTRYDRWRDRNDWRWRDRDHDRDRWRDRDRDRDHDRSRDHRGNGNWWRR